MKEQAYKVFDYLKEDQSINILKFAKNDPKAFIQYAKDYIDDFGSLVFSDDMAIVTKCKSRIEVSQLSGINVILEFNKP